MTVVMLKMVAFGFQRIVVFILDFPPTAPGGDDLDHVLVVDRERGDKGVLIQDVTVFIPLCQDRCRLPSGVFV